MVVPQRAPHIDNPGRDAQVPKNNLPLPEANIVETYSIGESKVHICDNYMAKTPEEINKVVMDMHEKAWAIIRDIQEKGGAV